MPRSRRENHTSQEEIFDIIDPTRLFPTIPSPLQGSKAQVEAHEQVDAINSLKEEHSWPTGKLKTQPGATQQAPSVKRASIPPVSKAPLEILDFIFTIHVCDNEESPWPLMHVSKRWRSAALMTRRIWARIALSPSNWTQSDNGPRSRSFKGMEICIKEGHLIRALQRAGVGPLDLKLMVLVGAPKSRGTFRFGKVRVAKEQLELCQLLNAIPKHMPNPRIRSLEISTFTSFTFREDAFDVLEKFSFAALRSLKLDYHYRRIVEKVAKEAMGPSNLHLPTESLEIMKQCKWWNKLDGLTTMEYYHNPYSVVDIRPILSTTRRLNSLSLSRAGITSEESLVYGHEEFDLPLLTHLRLTASRVFWPIKCPSLTHLEIFHIPTGIKEPAERSIRLPHLVQLFCCASPELFHLFRAFDAPALRRLKLLVVGGKESGERGLKALWPLRLFSTPSQVPFTSTIEPVIFELHRTNISSKWLARILSERMPVEEFISDAVLITYDFFEGLFPTKKTPSKEIKANGQGPTQENPPSDSQWYIGCPKLRRLVIDLSHYSPNKEKQVERSRLLDSAQKLMFMRSLAGVPLEKLAIRFSEQEEWVEASAHANDIH